MLNIDPEKRLSAKEVLRHEWFQSMKDSKTVIISEDVLKNL